VVDPVGLVPLQLPRCPKFILLDNVLASCFRCVMFSISFENSPRKIHGLASGLVGANSACGKLSVKLKINDRGANKLMLKVVMEISAYIGFN
jgi:hypothetical protein